ncbi:hypothetical protein JCM14450A_03730 [Geobacillus stearothermophilus]
METVVQGIVVPIGGLFRAHSPFGRNGLFCCTYIIEGGMTDETLDMAGGGGGVLPFGRRAGRLQQWSQ